MNRPIAISLSPNLYISDVFLAVRLFLSPWAYYGSFYTNALEQWFRRYFAISYAVSFNSGRAAFLAILKAMGAGPGDEVLLQAFTCVVVPDAVIATGAKPVYVDTTSYFTMDAIDLERKITRQTKAVVVQHTFGIPTDMDEILKIAKKYNLIVIEDAAHTVGSEYQGRKLGVIGDAAFFSFGRDKGFSSIFGGMAITNSANIGKKLRSYQRGLSKPSFFWVMQQLFHPIAFSFILPLYNTFSFGKIVLFLLQKLHFLSFPVSSLEREGDIKGFSVKKMPNQLAALAFYQLKRIKEFNQKRKRFTQTYIDELQNQPFQISYKTASPLLRFPILIDNKYALLQYFKKRSILLGDWYGNIIDPKGSELKKVFYDLGSCPNAENLAKKVVNLPTYPTMIESDVLVIIGLLKDYARNKRG